MPQDIDDPRDAYRSPREEPIRPLPLTDPRSEASRASEGSVSHSAPSQLSGGGVAVDEELRQWRLQSRSPRLCVRFQAGAWEEPSPAGLAREMRFSLYVNELELVSMLCTPQKLDYLALGFLYSEGIIRGLEDVVSLRVCVDDALIDVRLTRSVELPQTRTLTSGCGGGVAFDLTSASLPVVDASARVDPEQVIELMKLLETSQPGGRGRRGTHVSALSDGKRLLVTAEDVGRHNTLDKITGECLARGLPTAGHLLLSTGRISWEMLTKAARMQVAVVASRNSPTDHVAALAEQLGIGVLGYVRGGSLTVFAGEHRVRGCPPLRH